MDLPELKYHYADGRRASEFMLRDGIDCRYIEHPGGYGAWYTRAGLALTQGCTISNGPQEEDRQGGEGDGRIQAGNTAHRQDRTGKGSNRQKPEAGDRHCSL